MNNRTDQDYTLNLTFRDGPKKGDFAALAYGPMVDQARQFVAMGRDVVMHYDGATFTLRHCETGRAFDGTFDAAMWWAWATRFVRKYGMGEWVA